MPTLCNSFRGRIVLLAIALLSTGNLSADRVFRLPVEFLTAFPTASDAADFLRDTRNWVFAEPLEMIDLYGMGDGVSLLEEEVFLAQKRPSLFRKDPGKLFQEEQSQQRRRSGSSTGGAFQGLTDRMVEISSFDY